MYYYLEHNKPLKQKKSLKRNSKVMSHVFLPLVFFIQLYNELVLCNLTIKQQTSVKMQNHLKTDQSFFLAVFHSIFPKFFSSSMQNNSLYMNQTLKGINIKQLWTELSTHMQFRQIPQLLFFKLYLTKCSKVLFI